jgi:hypothetical protein
MTVSIVTPLGSSDRRRQSSDLLPRLFVAADTVDQIEHGYRLVFADGTVPLSHIGSIIDAERECCPFLQFHLSVTPDFGAVTLDITGGSGTRKLLGALVTRHH